MNDNEVLRLAMQMFSDGVDVARAYGDNAFHLAGEQLDRQFWRAWERNRRGDRNVQPPSADQVARAFQPSEEGTKSTKTLRDHPRDADSEQQATAGTD